MLNCCQSACNNIIKFCTIMWYDKYVVCLTFKWQLTPLCTQTSFEMDESTILHW